LTPGRSLSISRSISESALIRLSPIRVVNVPIFDPVDPLGEPCHQHRPVLGFIKRDDEISATKSLAETCCGMRGATTPNPRQFSRSATNDERGPTLLFPALKSSPRESARQASLIVEAMALKRISAYRLL
jgi:hypothetical protein